MRVNTSLFTLATLALAGCAAPGTADTDGDGLADSYELEIGTNPESEDSDGDGWTDSEEIYDFTDPDDEDSHPYTGGWKRMPIPDDIGDEGRAVGDVIENFFLEDQFGEEVELHRFFGNVILIESAAEW